MDGWMDMIGIDVVFQENPICVKSVYPFIREVEGEVEEEGNLFLTIDEILVEISVEIEDYNPFGSCCVSFRNHDMTTQHIT